MVANEVREVRADGIPARDGDIFAPVGNGDILAPVGDGDIFAPVGDDATPPGSSFSSVASVPSGTTRLASALARPVSLVRNGRKRRRTPSPPQPAPGQVVACHVYRDGHRVPEEGTYVDAFRAARERHGSFVWLGLFEPTGGELAAVADVFEIDPRAVHDAGSTRKRSKLAQYDGVLLLNLVTTCYVEHPELTGDSEVVDTGQVSVFIGKEFVVTVRRGAHGELQKLRAELEGQPAMLRHGPAAVLHAICTQVVEDYRTVTERLESDLDAIEAAVFDRSKRPTAEKVYQFKRELLELKHAVAPSAAPLRNLTAERMPLVDAHMRMHFRDVADQLEQTAERINHFDELITSVLQATLTQVTVAQNEDMRRISAWVAIGAVPTAMAGIYGMNFEHMPELQQIWGYPAVLALIVIICLTLYRTFKRNNWL